MESQRPSLYCDVKVDDTHSHEQNIRPEEKIKSLVEDGQVAWMFGDVGLRRLFRPVLKYFGVQDCLALTVLMPKEGPEKNPLRWSRGLSFKAAIHQLRCLEHNHCPRPIFLRIPADDADVTKFDNVTKAIAHMKKCKKIAAVAKAQGIECDDFIRWQAIDEKFMQNFGRKRPDIRHIVCLMLENRTFDGVQGHFMNERYKSGEVARSKWDQDGKDLFEYSNPVVGKDSDGIAEDFPVWMPDISDPNLMTPEYLSIPAGPAGPVEKFHFLNMCTYGVMRPTQDDLDRGPDMKGFAQQYYFKELANMPDYELAPAIAATCFKTKRSPVMNVYRKEQMSVFTQLSELFGCSDCHFSSAPCQTWPNRLFAACGTCFGYYNNLPYVNKVADAKNALRRQQGFYDTENDFDDETEYFQSEEVAHRESISKMNSSYDSDTIFHRLEHKGCSWGIYHGQASLAVITTKLKWDPMSIEDNVHTLAQFVEDVEANNLPDFVWLEPNYDPNDPEANDMHPPANVLKGQKLVADVYNTLRNKSQVWKHTLFIVTCDEGVGSFDHVTPPAAVDPIVGHDHEYVAQRDGAPKDMSSNPFERYGTRVPNLLVSPYIRPGSVVRPQGHDDGEAPYPFCHTSILRTAFELLLAEKADPNRKNSYMTQRDLNAPSFVHALESDICNHGGKDTVACPAFGSHLHKRPTTTCHSAGHFKKLMTGTSLSHGGNLAQYFGL